MRFLGLIFVIIVSGLMVVFMVLKSRVSVDVDLFG